VSTPEELLCSRKWRLQRGAWMLWGWVPFAFTAWVGYLIIGIRARNWKWIAAAAGFFIFGTAFFFTISWFGNTFGGEKGDPYPEPWGAISGAVLVTNLLVWIGNAAILQWFVNRKWLLWRAHHDKRLSTPWYATATAGTAQSAAPAPAPERVNTAIGDALAAPTTPTTSPPPPPAPVQAAPTVGASPLDVNSASEAELAALPGFDATTAAQIVTARSQAGGFRDVTELVTRAGVKPHLLAGVQGQVTVTPAPSTPQPPPPAAPANGRRLEF